MLRSALKSTPEQSDARAYGSLALARWHLFHGEVDAAIETIASAKAANRSLHEELDLLRADCLTEQGHAREALAVLARLAGRHSDDPALTLRAGIARLQLEDDPGHGSGPIVEALNTIYRRGELAMVWRSRVTRPVGLENLSCASPPAEPAEASPLVTVVTWPDEAGDVPVLESLCRQSWSNLEILVLVGSTSSETGGRDRLTVDPRVTLIGDDPSDVSPIAVAVERGTGDLVTAQPPGAWVHRQRIELQAAAMVADPALHGTVVSHMVVGPGCRPLPLAPARGRALVGPAPQLTMWRVGDRSASELVARSESVLDNVSPVTGAVFPPDGVALLHPDVPLVLSHGLTETG